MKPKYHIRDDVFSIENYNQARPFSSFLPGVAGEAGRPMWVFYVNRGQCLASFGIRNKNGAMLEFYPANKAYQTTPLLGFRTFLRLQHRGVTCLYEPFGMQTASEARQTLHIRPHEIEIGDIHRGLGLETSVVFFNAPNENVPVLVRQLTLRNTSRRTISLQIADGLPQVVPYGLNESLLKQMSRTMEAFAEVQHLPEKLPFYKLKSEPSDTPEVHWLHGGFFAFAQTQGRALDMIVDPGALFGAETSFQTPAAFLEDSPDRRHPQRTETLTASAFSVTPLTLRPGVRVVLDSYYGYADTWDVAREFRQRVISSPDYPGQKRRENAGLIRRLTDAFSLHASMTVLDPYSRQTYLDNTLRGGQPFISTQDSGGVLFHYYTRKHGDLERDYNFFELAPTYFSQGSANFRDVNQNRRSEVLLYPRLSFSNVQTFFNLIQLDGYNPLVIQYEMFSLEKESLALLRSWMDPKVLSELQPFLNKSFSPGELYQRLCSVCKNKTEALRIFSLILKHSQKIQLASHGEGFWVDHWTYNLDHLESYLAVYPDETKSILIDRRDFTYYDNDHIVQPRSKKYVRTAAGAVRQWHAVVLDHTKRDLLKLRRTDPHKVRTKNGLGPIYQTSLLVKILGLIGIKAATLDPFGVGLEMEADKPGWCDALNGLPGLLGSSVNEALELRRWITFTKGKLPLLMAPAGKHRFPLELVELWRSVRKSLAASHPDHFMRTWEALAATRETFREKTRLGLSGTESDVSRPEIEQWLDVLEKVLDRGLRKAFLPNGLCLTYFMNEAVRFEEIPGDGLRVLQFKQIPLSPFLEGPVHALRVASTPSQARRLYKAVRSSALYDPVLKMYRSNAPLVKEPYEIGRIKIFTPGWLENESIFLHMTYKYMLETLRSGLAKEFFQDLRQGLVAFQSPETYGRSIFENSSFIASSRFPDQRLRGTGFVARLTGATAEWISMVLYMGLGSQPFQWVNQELRFEPHPTMPGWLFAPKATREFEKNTFGFKVFGRTWVVYRNPSRRDTFGSRAPRPVRYRLRYGDGRDVVREGRYLPDALARDLRNGELSRVVIDLK